MNFNQHTGIVLLSPQGLEAYLASFKEAKEYMWTSSHQKDNLAIISVKGVLSQHSWSDNKNMQSISTLINAADEDEGIEAIVLDIDSPGGTVEGIISFAQTIQSSQKPIVSFAQEMQSGALWAGVNTDYIIAPQSIEKNIGSIGVKMVHREYSEYYKKEGIGVTIFTNEGAEKKVYGNPYEKLSTEAKADIQEEIDNIGVEFKNVVRSNRKKLSDEEKVFSGKSFTSSEAKELGLIDKIGTLEDALSKATALAEKRHKNKPQTYYSNISTMFGNKRKEKPQVTAIETFKQDYPRLKNLVVESEDSGVYAPDTFANICKEISKLEEEKATLSKKQETFEAEKQALEAKITALENKNKQLAKMPSDTPTEVQSDNNIELSNEVDDLWLRASYNLENPNLSK